MPEEFLYEAAEDGWNRMQAWFKQYGVLG